MKPKHIVVYCIDDNGLYQDKTSEAYEIPGQPGQYLIHRNCVSVRPNVEPGHQAHWNSPHPDYLPGYQTEGHWVIVPIPVTIYQVDADGFYVGKQETTMVVVGPEFQHLPAGYITVEPPAPIKGTKLKWVSNHVVGSIKYTNTGEWMRIVA
jgi:hypothetical protein